jgi:hypothetical protein
VKRIDEARKKNLYIELDSKKRQQHISQEETDKKRDKKMKSTVEKRRDPNKHCQHCYVDGNVEEKCWKLHPKLCPK